MKEVTFTLGAKHKFVAANLLWPAQAHLLHSRKQRGWLYSQKVRSTVSPFDLPIGLIEDRSEILALAQKHFRFGEKFKPQVKSEPELTPRRCGRKAIFSPPRGPRSPVVRP